MRYVGREMHCLSVMVGQGEGWLSRLSRLMEDRPGTPETYPRDPSEPPCDGTPADGAVAGEPRPSKGGGRGVWTWLGRRGQQQQHGAEAVGDCGFRGTRAPSSAGSDALSDVSIVRPLDERRVRVVLQEGAKGWSV